MGASGVLSEEVQLVVNGAPDAICAVRLVQLQERPVLPFSVEFMWPALGLDGEYLYSSTLSMGGLLPI